MCAFPCFSFGSGFGLGFGFSFFGFHFCLPVSPSLLGDILCAIIRENKICFSFSFSSGFVLAFGHVLRNVKQTRQTIKFMVKITQITHTQREAKNDKHKRKIDCSQYKRITKIEQGKRIVSSICQALHK